MEWVAVYAGDQIKKAGKYDSELSDSLSLYPA